MRKLGPKSSRPVAFRPSKFTALPTTGKRGLQLQTPFFMPIFVASPAHKFTYKALLYSLIWSVVPDDMISDLTCARFMVLMLSLAGLISNS